MSHAPFSDLFPLLPFKGVGFRDIGPFLRSSDRFHYYACLALQADEQAPDANILLALDARGYLVAEAIAGLMKSRPGVVQLRKPGKLPGETTSLKYSYEYASAEFELVKGSIRPGDNFLVVDDVLATGGSARAARQLGEQEGGHFEGLLCLVELDDLGGAKHFQPLPVISLVKFAGKRSVEEVNAQQQEPMISTVVAEGILPPSPKDQKVLLFSLPSMEQKARQLVTYAPHVFKQAPVSWKAFPDQWGNIMFPDADALDSDQKHLVYLGSFYKPSYVMEQLSMVTAMCGQPSLSSTLDFPFLPVTFERVTRDGAATDSNGMVKFKQQAVATGHTLLKQLSGAISGRPRLRYFDIHAEAVRFYNNDKELLPVESSMLPSFIRLLATEYSTQHTMLVFPDDGALKRFMPFLVGSCYTIATCVKKRGAGEERQVSIKDIYHPIEDGKHERVAVDYFIGDNLVQQIFLIDDLVQSGSTLRECGVELSAKFPRAVVNAFAVHPIFPQDAHLRFTAKGKWAGTFTKFYVCNTVPEVASKLQGLPPFQIIDTTPVVADKYFRQFGLTSASFYGKHVVYVASKSREKLEGVRNAFHAHFPFAIIEVQTATMRPLLEPVNPQPRGEIETLKGAMDRLMSVPPRSIDIEPSTSWVVSVESGSYLKPYTTTEYVDQAVVIVKNLSTGRTVYNHSYPVHIPANCMEQSIATGCQQTAGEFIALQYVTSPTNWHMKVGGVSRPDLIKQAVEELLYQF